MLTSQVLRTRTSIAYACFMVPGAAALLSTIAPLLAPSLLDPAYLGFFVLIPLVLISALAVPIAIFLTFTIGRREPGLVVLSAATPLLVAAALAEFGDGMLLNVAFALYGLGSIATGCYWFASKRKNL